MISKSSTLMVTGELILGMSEPSPEFYFDLVAPTLRSADIVVAQLEVPHTSRPAPTRDLAMPAPPPENLRGIPYAGINIVTLAGNPTFAYGIPGIIDTIDWLKEHEVAYVGAGMNINEARRPVVIERNGTRFGFLSRNCVGPAQSSASYSKPGCAYVDIVTHYEAGAFPGSQPRILTIAEPWSLEAMREDIRNLRPNCDVLSVALHKGGSMTEISLMDYEFEVSYAAIDAGADIIIGNHTHVLRGIEFYKRKPIFHCMCNLVTVFPWESHRMFRQEPESTLTKSKLRGKAGNSRSWIDLEYPYYPFPAASRNTIIAKCVVEDGKISRISYLPCLINKQGQPEILKHDARGQEIFNYMEEATRGAGLNTHYEWDIDEVVIHE